IFPRREALEHLCGPVAKAVVAHVDERPVRRFERVARVELGDAVGPDQLPVGAAGEHPAREPLAYEPPAGDGDDASASERSRTEFLRRRKLDVSLEEGLQSQWSSAP